MKEYLSRKSNKKISAANIQPYFVGLVHKYNFTLKAQSM